MQQKYIAIGVAVVLAIAAIGGGIALTTNTNDNDIKTPDISGKWNLEYIELAKLSDDNEKAILDPELVKIEDRYPNPYEPVAYIDVTETGAHGFKGKLVGKSENDIAGSRNGHVIKFSIVMNEHLHLFELSAREDRLSGSMTVMNHSGEGVDPVVCGIAYMLFIRDGEDPVPIRSDYFDMNIMKVATPIKATLHEISDFTQGDKNGRGTDLNGTMKFAKIHNMISIFSIYAENSTDIVGVQAVVSLGTSPNGAMGGVIAGNIKSPHQADKNWTVTGNMVISNGKAMFLNYHHPDSTGSYPSFIEMEFNVPYNNGAKLTPVYINQKSVYKGTLTIKNADAEPTEVEITKTFKVFDNTFYSEFVQDSVKYMWFGEIYGHSIVLHVVDSGLKEVGHLTGHVDRDGDIHLFGVVVNTDTDKLSFLDINLELAE